MLQAYRLWQAGLGCAGPLGGGDAHDPKLQALSSLAMRLSRRGVLLAGVQQHQCYCAQSGQC